MPAYIYKCEIHGEFEEIHSIKTKLEHCPLCEKEGKTQEVKRLIAFTNFILSGSGWGKDNYK